MLRFSTPVLFGLLSFLFFLFFWGGGRVCSSINLLLVVVCSSASSLARIFNATSFYFEQRGDASFGSTDLRAKPRGCVFFPPGSVFFCCVAKGGAPFYGSSGQLSYTSELSNGKDLEMAEFIQDSRRPLFGSSWLSCACPIVARQSLCNSSYLGGNRRRILNHLLSHQLTWNLTGTRCL